MTNIIDALFFNSTSGPDLKIDPKVRINLVISSLQGYSKGMVYVRSLMCLGVYYYCGIVEAISVFFGFEILRIAVDYFLEKTRIQLENNEISIEKAETNLMMNPFSRVFCVGIVFVLLKNIEDPNAHETAILCVVGISSFLIYQNSNSLKLLLASIIPSIILLLGDAIIDAFKHQYVAPIVAPILYSIVFVALGFLSHRDRMRGLAIRLEIENKTENLEKLILKQNKENKIRENIERIAAVGTFSYYYYEGKAVWSAGALEAFGFYETDTTPSIDDFVKIVAPYNRKQFFKSMRDARVHSRGFELSLDIVLPKNEHKTLTCHATPIFNDMNEVIGVEGIVIDQTEVKKAINEASEAQELLHIALSNGRSVVIDRNLTTGEMKGFGALDIFDISKDDNSSEVKKKVMKCLGRRDTHIVFGAMGRAETSGEIQFAEHSIVQANGNEIKVRVAMGVEGQIKKGNDHFISITTDITDEVKRREELAKALKESTRASRVKSEFLANMSHEIRTPLNGVIAVTGLLARTNLENDQREMVEMIENSGVALNHIINDVLDLSRVESGRLEIEQIEFNLKEALQSVTTLFSVKADEKGLDFKIEINEEADNIFIGDPIRIRQIIGNLISNAIKFTQNGQVALEAKFEHIDENGNLNCSFIISDTGDGLSPEALSRLFERFEQADGSITRKHGGSGLGLSISRALANLMGGDIKVTSKLEEGSEFTFEIPLKRSINNEVKTPYKNDIDIIDSQNEGEDHALKILGVDDNATNRKVLEMVLNPLGVELTLCENGLEALNAFKLQKYDIILMDLQMPIMDGLTAISKIREYEAKKSLNPTPIIAVSANAMSHHVDEAIQFGANFHIAKPFTMQGLIDSIENALNEFEVAQHEKMLDCA